jgi:hypothetical protein
MSASDNGATVPVPLGEGLLEGEAGNPVVMFKQVLEQAIAAMNGQNQHNGATTAALRTHQQTLLTHSNLLNANKTSIKELATSVKTNKDLITTQTTTLESHGTLIKTNTDEITNHKTLIDANTAGVASLKSAKTAIEAKLEAHKNWQDNFTDLQGTVTSKNEYEILGLQKKHATQQLQLVEFDDKLDKQILALKTIGEVAEAQDKAIDINRTRTISNAKAINDLQAEMVIEQEISDERFLSVDTIQDLRSCFDKQMAANFNAIGTLFTSLAKKTEKLNTDTKKAKYNPEQMELWLPPVLQGRYETRRRKRGKRKGNKSWQGDLTVPKVTVGKSYKKAKLADKDNWKSVPTEAKNAIERTATHSHAKVHAETLLAQTNAALAAHEEKEERRRQEVQDQREMRQEDEMRQQEVEEERRLDLLEEQGLVQEQNGQNPQRPDLQEPPSNNDDNNSEETDEETYICLPQNAPGVVSPEN